MNNRVKELLEQSGLQPYYDAQEAHINKFAELIIQECIAVCLNQRNPQHLNYKPSESFAESIRLHFGLK